MGLLPRRRRQPAPHVDVEVERETGRLVGKLEAVTERLADVVARVEHEARVEDRAREALAAREDTMTDE